MRKIGELKGKPIIEGNPNEIKKNQIHYEEKDGNITLSERKGDNTLSSVTSGSGSGDGGNAFQYFKIINESELAISIISSVSKIVEIILEYNDAIIKVNIMDGYNLTDDSLAGYLNNSGCRAFKCLLGDNYVLPFSTTANSEIIHFKGNTVFDKVHDYANKMGMPNEQLNEFIFEINSAFQEITKEEYEAMITYKPE